MIGVLAAGSTFLSNRSRFHSPTIRRWRGERPCLTYVVTLNCRSLVALPSQAAGAARSVGAALRPPPARPLRPRAPLRKIIMQLPGRPMWNVLRPRPARNQSVLKCVVTHTPSITMDYSCRD
ncbi:unnamed protein product [Leptosia nina]|uniref:Uncharacterized protein n=1 Tax=Leptosia nina TaxID=320188 RepID=A0AAV1JJL6_9NEOP